MRIENICDLAIDGSVTKILNLHNDLVLQSIPSYLS